jgi:ketosteroid isomerase-like protein
MEPLTPRKNIRAAAALGAAAGILVLIVIPLLYNRFREVPPVPPPVKSEAENVAAVLAAQVAAWNAGDLDGYMAGYWDSPDLEFVSDTTTKGFQPVKERYFKRYKAQGKEMGFLTFRDVAVSVKSPEAAVVTGKWKVVKTTETASGGFVVKLRKFEDGWKIVQDTTTSDDPPKK